MCSRTTINLPLAPDLLIGIRRRRNQYGAAFIQPQTWTLIQTAFLVIP
jgi:hypothetical protein